MNTEINKNQTENINNMEMTNDQLMTRFFDIVEQIKERGIEIPVIENEKMEKPENVITTTITSKVNMILAINAMTGNEIGKFTYNKKTFESFEIDGMNFKKFQEEIQKNGVVSKVIKNGDNKTWANLTVIQVEHNDVPKVSITTGGGKHNGGCGVGKPCKLYDKVLNKVTYWDSVRQMVNILFKGGESSNFCRNARENTDLGVDIVNDEDTLFIHKKRYAVSYL